MTNIWSWLFPFWVIFAAVATIVLPVIYFSEYDSLSRTEIKWYARIWLSCVFFPVGALIWIGALFYVVFSYAFGEKGRERNERHY